MGRQLRTEQGAGGEVGTRGGGGGFPTCQDHAGHRDVDVDDRRVTTADPLSKGNDCARYEVKPLVRFGSISLRACVVGEGRQEESSGFHTQGMEGY